MSEEKFTKLEGGSAIEVEPFVMQDLSGQDRDTFRTPTLGPGATLPKAKRVAVPPRPSKEDQKGRRFQVDPVLKELLSADEVTEAEIERRVEAKLAILRGETINEAREKGYEEGHERGRSEAKKAFETAASEKLERFDAFLNAAESLKDELFKANERFLVELIFRIAGNVLQKEIASDPEYVTRLVRSIVEKVGVKEHLKMIAPASQIEALHKLSPELEKKHTGLKNISIELSSQLGENDVVIETDWNRIDATLESQMATLHETLITGLEESQAEETDDGDKESA